MRRHSIGIVGYGGFGRFLHSAWARTGRADVIALADRDPTRDPGNIRFYTDWRSLLQDRDVDVVSIVTPPSTHAAIACAALEDGKHVLVEKPVATSLEEAHRIRETRDRCACIATVDFMLRFNPIVELLQHWCRTGRFGRLRRVAVENYAQDESLPPNHWFWDRTISGGILVEHAVHFFDIVQWCCGSEPIRVDGVAVSRTPQQEDRVLATVVHEDGLLATHFHSFCGPDVFERTSMRFVFDRLKIDVDGWIPMSGRAVALGRGNAESELLRLPGFRAVSHTRSSKAEASDVVAGEFSLPTSKSEAYQAALCALMSDFLAAVEEPGHALRVSLEDGIESLELALGASADARRRPPATSP